MNTLASSSFAQKTKAIPLHEPTLSAEQLAIAERVHVGRVRCELGAHAAVLADEKAPGYFNVTDGKNRFRMHPEPTTTGAIRLVDKARGGVWLQLANKSMLLDEKNGRRLADDCANAAQQAVAEQLKAAPAATILDNSVSK